MISTNRLLMLACSSTKIGGPKWMPALNRYNGPLWQTLRTVDQNSMLATPTAVSANYGFISAHDTIKVYDHRMTPELAKEFMSGSMNCRFPLDHKPGTAGGYYLTYVIASLHDGIGRPFDEVAIVGGALYLRVMRYFIEQFQARGHITADAPVVEINGAIGHMRAQLAAWLNERAAAEVA